MNKKTTLTSNSFTATILWLLAVVLFFGGDSAFAAPTNNAFANAVGSSATAGTTYHIQIVDYRAATHSSDRPAPGDTATFTAACAVNSHDVDTLQ